MDEKLFQILVEEGHATRAHVIGAIADALICEDEPGAALFIADCYTLHRTRPKEYTPQGVLAVAQRHGLLLEEWVMEGTRGEQHQQESQRDDRARRDEKQALPLWAGEIAFH